MPSIRITEPGRSLSRGDFAPRLDMEGDDPTALGPLDDFIAWMAGWFEWFIQGLFGFLGDLLNNLAQFMADFLTNLFFSISDLFSSITTSIGAAFQTIITTINGVLSAVGGIVDTVLARIESFYNATVNAIASLYNQVVASLWTAYEVFTSRLTQAFNAVVAGITDFVASVTTTVTNFLTGLDQTFNSAITEIADAVLAYIGDVATTLGTFLDESLLGASGLVELIAERLGDFGTGFADAAATVLEGITGLDDSVRESLGVWLEKLGTEIAAFAEPAETSALINSIRALTDGEASAAEYREFVRAGWSSVVPESAFWRAVFVSVAACASAVPVLLGVANAAAQPVLQEFNATFPTTLLSPGDVLAAWRRGQVTKDHATDVIRRQGYATSDVELLFEITEQVPAEIDLLSMRHRDIISEPQLDSALRQRGYDDEWRAALKKASFLIPPTSDLITMAVREVFSPNIRAELRLDEDFPQRFADEAAKQGLSEEWARNYWAAHWSLPSPRQGFEMLHRGLITEDRLDTLLRALDVMPVWREAMKGIAYSPFTRVDIRRMHRMRVLTREEVVTAHKEIGYSPDKAELLTEFVERLNKNAPTEDDVELGRLSRAAVLGFYDDGLLPANRTAELLVDLGHTPEAAALYIASVDQGDERRERAAETSLILDMATAGTLTFAEAQDKLGQIGLETRERDKALIQLVRIQSRRTKLPTLAQGGAMLKAGVMTVESYRLLLARLGYAPEWIGAFEAMALRGRDDAENAG